MALPLETVPISSLCPPTDLDAALACFEGFAEVVGATAPAPPRPFWLLRDRGWEKVSAAPAGLAPPLGLNFVRDLTLCGSGYVFSAGRFIREAAHTSDVALQWLQDDAFPDNPRNLPHLRDVRIGQPGLIVFGPGYPIYGHWLVDFLARIALAQQALGELFSAFVIPLPDDAPDWLSGMLAFFCGIGRAQIRPFDRTTERLRFASACLPSFAHAGDQAMHPFATRFFRSFVTETDRPPGRRICLSRRNFEAATRSAWRVFESRPRFEAMATARGYEIVCPEDLDLRGQIELFAQSTHLVGEFGSAMHNAIFSGPGTRVGCFPLNNAIQNSIAAACGHDAVYVDRAVRRTDSRGVVFFDIDEADLAAMFERMDRPA